MYLNTPTVWKLFEINDLNPPFKYCYLVPKNCFVSKFFILIFIIVFFLNIFDKLIVGNAFAKLAIDIESTRKQD